MTIKTTISTKRYRGVLHVACDSNKPLVFRNGPCGQWCARVPYDGRLAQVYAFESWHDAVQFALIGEVISC